MSESKKTIELIELLANAFIGMFFMHTINICNKIVIKNNAKEEAEFTQILLLGFEKIDKQKQIDKYFKSKSKNIPSFQSLYGYNHPLK